MSSATLSKPSLGRTPAVTGPVRIIQTEAPEGTDAAVVAWVDSIAAVTLSSPSSPKPRTSEQRSASPICAVATASDASASAPSAAADPAAADPAADSGASLGVSMR